MSFYRVSNPGIQLVPGTWGIQEPIASCAEYKISNDVASQSDLCLIPGIAFDCDGYRLGYGKGYYDRFLTAFHGIRVGVAYHDFILDQLPHDRHDQPMHILMNERGPWLRHEN